MCVRPQTLACADFNLGTQLPVRWIGPVNEDFNDENPSCGGPHYLEHVFGWTAPTTGKYVIDTAGSVFDTLVEVRNSTCGGPVLSCNDNGISYGGASRIVAELQGGQSIAIVLDGGMPNDYSYAHLNISRLEASEAGKCGDVADNDGDGRIDCADSDCSSTPQCKAAACSDRSFPGLNSVVTYAEREPTNLFVGTCTGSGTPDEAIAFTAPQDGDYVFLYQSDDDDRPIRGMYLLDGCRGRELACRTPGFRHYIRQPLKAGETVLLVVDGWSWYQVKVEEYQPTEHGRCGDAFDNDGDGSTDDGDTDCH
jgi:hypothetical protein